MESLDTLASLDRRSGGKITAVEAVPVAAPEYPSGAWIIVRLRTESGIEGIGECFVPDRNGCSVLAAKALIDESLGAAALGECVLEITRLWEKLYEICSRMYDRRGIAISALSGIDIACHDAAAKLLGIPVYQLLGGRCQNSIAVYLSCIYVDPLEPAGAIAETKHYAAAGFGILKYYGWPGFGDDEERDIGLLRNIRSAAGASVGLALDLGRSRSFAEAYRRACMIERADIGLRWWEEPLSSTDDRRSFVRLSNRTSLILAAGEAEITSAAHRDLLLADCIGLLQPDLTLVGGLTEGRRICDLGRAFQTIVAPHNWGTMINFAASLHLLTASSASSLCEYPITSRMPNPQRGLLPSPMMTELVSHDYRVERGQAFVPDSPGLGVKLDLAAVDRYRLK